MGRIHRRTLGSKRVTVFTLTNSSWLGPGGRQTPEWDPRPPSVSGRGRTAVPQAGRSPRCPIARWAWCVSSGSARHRWLHPLAPELAGAGAMGIPQGRAPGQHPHFSPFHLAKPPYPKSISAKEFPRHLCLPATLCGVPAHSDGIWLEEFEAGLVVSVMPPESSPQVVWSWESPPRGHPRACC